MPPTEQSSLLGFPVERVTAVVEFDRVSVENSSEARYYADERGRKWVGKKYADTGFQPVLAELIAWPVSCHLGVRSPSAAVYGHLKDDSLIWLSEYVPNTIHWRQSEAAFVSNPDELGAMLTLDAVLLNEDRHAKNLLLVPVEDKESQMVAWAVDSGNALVGQPADFPKRIDDVPSTKNLAKGLPIERLRDGARAAAAQAESLANSPLVQGYVDAACALVSEPSGQILFETLRSRLLRASALVDRYLKEIEASL